MKQSLATALVVILLSSCSSNNPATISFPKEIGRFKLEDTERALGNSDSFKRPRDIINVDVKPPDGTTQYKGFYTLADGRTLVIYSVLVFPTASEASEEIGFFEDKADVIERGSKLDVSGKPMGKRIIQSKFNTDLITISWNEGSRYCRIAAESLKIATEFEDALLKSHSK